MIHSIKFTLLIFTFCSTLLAFGQNTRVEKDEYGEMKVPSNAHYGLNVARAMKYLNISNETLSDYPDFVKSLAYVKLAAIQVNSDNSVLSQEKAMMLDRASWSIINGAHTDAFQFELYNGSQGYLANAAMNEVLANLAIEMSGARKGNYKVISPSEDVNINQNYQSVYQTALNISIVNQNESLLKELEALQTSLLTFSDQEPSSTSAGAVVPIAIQSVSSSFEKHLDSLSYHIANLQQSVANMKFHTMNGSKNFEDVSKRGFSEQISKALRTTTSSNFKYQNPISDLNNHLEYITTYLKALRELNDYMVLTCKFSQALDLHEAEDDPFAFSNINQDNGAPTWGHIIPGMVIENCTNTKGSLTAILNAVASKKKKSVYDLSLMSLEIMVAQQQLTKSIKTLRKNYLD